MARSWAMASALLVLGTAVGARVAQAPSPAQAAIRGGWTMPTTAAGEQNPLTLGDGVLANGRKLFLTKCQRCHGAQAKGDGPDADTRHRDHMNLTSGGHAVADNPDGVVFYKIWNGRSSPRMPAFSEELSREQAWAIVAYVQSLRPKQAAR